MHAKGWAGMMSDVFNTQYMQSLTVNPRTGDVLAKNSAHALL